MSRFINEQPAAVVISASFADSNITLSEKQVGSRGLSVFDVTQRSLPETGRQFPETIPLCFFIMSNFVGDLAFPDNPNRRKRAGELHDDVVAFGANFQKLYNERYVGVTMTANGIRADPCCQVPR